MVALIAVFWLKHVFMLVYKRAPDVCWLLHPPAGGCTAEGRAGYVPELPLWDQQELVLQELGGRESCKRTALRLQLLPQTVPSLWPRPPPVRRVPGQVHTNTFLLRGVLETHALASCRAQCLWIMWMMFSVARVASNFCLWTLDRLTQCKYKRIGCPWQGPFHELPAHEVDCCHPSKTGIELMGILDEMDQSHRRELQLYNSIFSLLSFEKIGFTGKQTNKSHCK